jgi:predicted nucleic acid-binding protein
VSYLLDTCLLSELPKSTPNAGVAAWVQATDESLLFVSALTFGELRKGIEKLADGQRKQAIRSWFERDVIARFRNRVIPADLDVCLRWGQLSAESERIGHPRPVLDALLASTALVHDLVLVTRNERDFDHPRLRVINPWT